MTTVPEQTIHRTLDRAGIIASVGCAIHCMLAPALLVIAPSLGGWWVHPGTHLAIAVFVLPVAASALWRGFGVHGKRWIIGVGGLGMLLVVIGVILPWAAPSDTGAAASAACGDCCPTIVHNASTGASSLRIPPASIVTILGGLALITAHVGNLRCACGHCASAAGTKQGPALGV